MDLSVWLIDSFVRVSATRWSMLKANVFSPKFNLLLTLWVPYSFAVVSLCYLNRCFSVLYSICFCFCSLYKNFVFIYFCHCTVIAYFIKYWLLCCVYLYYFLLLLVFLFYCCAPLTHVGLLLCEFSSFSYARA